MISLLVLIDKVIDIYTWIVIASAIASWLVAFGVINTRNQFIRWVIDFLSPHPPPALAALRPPPAQSRGRRHLAGDPAARFVLPAQPVVGILAALSDPSFLRRGMRGVPVELRVQPRARRTALETA